MGLWAFCTKEDGGGIPSDGTFCSFDCLKLPSSLSLSTNPVILYFYDARFGPKRAILLFFGGWVKVRAWISSPYFCWICMEGSAASPPLRGE